MENNEHKHCNTFYCHNGARMKGFEGFWVREEKPGKGYLKALRAVWKEKIKFRKK